MTGALNLAGFVQVDWVIEPPDLLGQARTVQRGGLWLQVTPEGVATARLDGFTDANGVHERVASAEAALKALLLGGQLTDMVPVSLRISGITGHRVDGSLQSLSLAASLAPEAKFGRADSTSADIDTRQARIERKRRLSEAILRHRSVDTTLERMCASFDAAMNDPADQLVHLYEVCEAFEQRVAATASELYRANKSICDRMGRVCNNKELLEGRHRGKAVSSTQRSATLEELGAVRAGAAALIEAYALALDEASTDSRSDDSWECDTVPAHSSKESLIISNEHASKARFGALLNEMDDEAAERQRAKELRYAQFLKLAELVILPTLRAAAEAVTLRGREAREITSVENDGRPIVRLTLYGVGHPQYKSTYTLEFSPSLRSNMVTVNALRGQHSEGEMECAPELIDRALVEEKTAEVLKRALATK